MRFGFNFGLYGGAGILPPIIDSLLVWLKGNDDGAIQKLDSHKKPYAENFTMSGSHCIAPNGTDEFGTLDYVPDLSGTYSCNFITDSTAVQVILCSGRFNVAGLQIRVHSATQLMVRTIGDLATTSKYFTFGTVLQEFSVSVSLTNTVGNLYDVVVTINGVVELEYNTPIDQYVAQHCIGSDYDTSSLMFSGKIWDVSYPNTHFRIAEGPGDGTNLTSFSDDYENDGHYITWTGIPATMWAQRQDSYHGNAVLGWWEISGDLIKYPYPVVGFTTHHKGGTLNLCETSYGPEGFPVGTFNSSDNVILLATPKVITGDFLASVYVDNHDTNYGGVLGMAGDTDYFYLQSTQVLLKINGSSYAFPTITDKNGLFFISRTGADITVSVNAQVETLTCTTDDWTIDRIGSANGYAFIGAIVRNPNINGLLIPINEGEGTDIHDSDGNVVGTLSGDPAFWEGEPMVSQAIGDAEAAADAFYFTDGNYHSVPKTQQEWISDGVINNDKQRYFCESLLFYREPLTAPEDGLVKDYLPCWTVTYLVDTNGDRLVDGNGDYLATIVEN